MGTSRKKSSPRKKSLPRKKSRTTRSLPSASPAAASYASHFEHTALFEFSKVINSSLDPHFVYSHILLTIMGKILSSKGMVALGATGKEVRVEAAKGFSQSLIGKGIKVEETPSNLFDIAVVDARRYPWVDFFRQAGVAILLPMVMADRLIGFLGFGERFPPQPLEEQQRTYLQSLANISATAIEKSRMLEETRQVNRKLDRKIQEMNTLFELGKEFGSLLDPEKLIRLLVFSLLGQVGVNRYLIALREGSDMRVAASRLDGSVPQSELFMNLAKLKGPVRVEDYIVKDSFDPRKRLSDAGLHVIVPMQLQGENRGLILLGGKLSKESFTDLDLEFLSSLANLAIISLENARLFKEAIEKQKLEDELLIAREIQKGLLPSVLPTIPGIDIAATNISSRQVGGDYYDVIPIEGERFIIAIGDVSGKGPPAALLMANLQATIRALVPLNISLSELTGKVNSLLCPNTGGSKFVTFFWGVYDPKDRSLNFVNAGHNYPFLVRSGGKVDRLDVGGMILGIMEPPMPYEQGTVTLASGDVLVLFTDGVSEAMDKNFVEYGEDRLEALISSHLASSADELVDLIHKDILLHAKGTSQSDDITMMIVKAF